MTALPFEDTTDFEDAEQGFVAKMDPCVVRNDAGRVVWDNDAYAFLGRRRVRRRRTRACGGNRSCARSRDCSR